MKVVFVDKYSFLAVTILWDRLPYTISLLYTITVIKKLEPKGIIWMPKKIQKKGQNLNILLSRCLLSFAVCHINIKVLSYLSINPNKIILNNLGFPMLYIATFFSNQFPPISPSRIHKQYQVQTIALNPNHSFQPLPRIFMVQEICSTLLQLKSDVFNLTMTEQGSNCKNELQQ